jgi:hypothetical protein
MSKNLSAPILIAVSALIWTPLAFSAGPQPADAAHDHSHGQAATTAPQKKAAPKNPAPKNAAQRNADMDAQIAHMRALHERLSRAKTPEERQALMAEQAQVMQESMALMHSTMPMQGGGMHGKMPMSQADMAEHMRMCHDMMGQRMEMMQEMMQMMMDRQGMGGGMDGQGMGAQGMGGGMMKP